MDIDSLLVQYRVYVNGELKLEGTIYREWFRQLYVVYGAVGNVVTIRTGNDWQQLFP